VNCLECTDTLPCERNYLTFHADSVTASGSVTGIALTAVIDTAGYLGGSGSHETTVFTTVFTFALNNILKSIVTNCSMDDILCNIYFCSQ